MNLYEINNEILSLIDVETGEISNFDKLEELNLARETKLENIALWIKNLKAEALALKVEKDTFAERQKQAENKAEKLKDYLSEMLCGQAFKTSKVSCSFRKSTVVDITDEERFIEWAKKNDNGLLKNDSKINKTIIKRMLQDGIVFNFDGLCLKENNNLQIK